MKPGVFETVDCWENIATMPLSPGTSTKVEAEGDAMGVAMKTTREGAGVVTWTWDGIPDDGERGEHGRKAS